MTRLHLATANTPGAIALLQLAGPEAPQVLHRLTGKADWVDGRVRLCGFDGIDEGLAVVRDPPDADPAHRWAQLMPHGGPRVVQRLIDRLIELGCTYEPAPDPRDIYPEAASPIEADVLHTIARAASPSAIDLLAEQPARWYAWLARPEHKHMPDRGAIRESSAVFDRLIDPPTVVVAGRANVGKSTLTNALMGRAVSIVADLPGTTRDWVGGMVELAGDFRFQISDFRFGEAGGAETADRPAPDPANRKSEIEHQKSLIAVRWLDTPGLRPSDDTVEQRAIALARSVVAEADVLIAMRERDSDWPAAEALPRTPDLWVVNKCDGPAAQAQAGGGSLGGSPDSPLRISAEQGHGLPLLQTAVITRLGLDSLGDATPWAFSPTLREWASGGGVDLAAYLGDGHDRQEHD